MSVEKIADSPERGARGSSSATGSAHPWKIQMANADKLAAARKRRATIRHVKWEKERYATEPEWAAARREYYKAKRKKSAPNISSSATATPNE